MEDLLVKLEYALEKAIEEGIRVRKLSPNSPDSIFCLGIIQGLRDAKAIFMEEE